MHFDIRPMTLSDAPLACLVHASAIRAIDPAPYTQAMIKAWTRSLTPKRMEGHLRKQGLVARAAMEGPRMRAFLLLHDDRLWALYVHGPCQRQGLGRRLVALAEELALDRGVEVLRLRSALPVRGFYERCGFHATDEVCITVESDMLMECLIMEKRLYGAPPTP